MLTPALIMAATAAPGTVCHSQISYSSHAPVVQQYALPVQHVNVYYGVGQSIQLSALVAKQLRSDAEYQQFLQWKARKARPSPPPQPPQEPTPADPSTAPPPEPVPQPQETTSVVPTREVATVASKCAQCHSGPAPKGNFLMDGVGPLDDIGRPTEMVMTGAMPPPVGPNGEELNTRRLTPLERYQVIEDLIRLKQLGEQQ